jgi:hypothetical protein
MIPTFNKYLVPKTNSNTLFHLWFVAGGLTPSHSLSGTAPNKIQGSFTAFRMTTKTSKGEAT